MGLLVACCLLLLLHRGFAHPTLNDSVRLRGDLLDGYAAVMPFCTAEPVRVSIDIYLYMLVHFDELQEIVTLNGWYNLNWTDCKLRWNSTLYNNLSCVEFPSISRLWVPDITWLERMPYEEVFELHPGILAGARAFVCQDGNVAASRQLLLKSSCKIDLTLFPFDTQRCSLTFMSWSYPNTHLILQSLSGVGNVSFVVLTGSWNVLSMPVYTQNYTSLTVCPEGCNHTILRYELVIQRLSSFYVFYLLLPAIFISLLACFVFYLPPQSQEKLSFVVSVVVALTVFMLLMVDITPQNEQIPIFSIYLFTVFALASLSVMVTVLVQIAYERQHCGAVPESLRCIFVHFLGAFAFFRPTETQRADADSAKSETRSALQSLQKCNSEGKTAQILQVTTTTVELVALKSQNEAVQVFTTGNSALFEAESHAPSVSTQQNFLAEDVKPDVSVSATASNAECYNDWWQVAYAVDRVLLLLYIASFMIVLLIYSVIIATSQQPADSQSFS